MSRTTRLMAILIAALALPLAATPAFAAEPPPGVAFDGVVMVVFHDPAYDNAVGIEGAGVTLTVVDLAALDVAIQELQGTTDAAGVASFTEVARPTDLGVELELQVTAARNRSSVDPDGCNVTEHLHGSATASAGLQVTIDVGVGIRQDERTCPPPDDDTPIIVEGRAVDEEGAPLPLEEGDATLTTAAGSAGLPVETAADGTFRVEVPAATDPGEERTLTVTLLGVGLPTIVDEQGCQYFIHPVAEETWTLVGNETPEPRTIIADDERPSAVCSQIPGLPPRPRPGPNPTPRPPVASIATLPPSDATTDPDADRDRSPAPWLIVLLASSLSGGVAAWRRVSRRGS